MTKNTKGGKFGRFCFILAVSAVWLVIGYMAHNLFEVAIRFDSR